ncbi:MAG: FAD synthetase family protein [Lachnospiraceae bacterium]|nr:FAD synthetase family protein [Lachnospiraceae bacterium]
MIYTCDRDFKFSNTAVSVGKFDGLHIGHRELIKHLLAYKKKGLKTAVLRLDFVDADSKAGTDRSMTADTPLLRSEDERKRILEECGIDIYIRYPFSARDFCMSAQDFSKRILAERLGAKAVVIGDDFRFGHGREGTPKLLAAMGEELGFSVEVVERVSFEGVPVSSSYIRECLIKGENEKAGKMLDKI